MAWSPIEKGASIGPLYKRSRRRRTDGRTNSRAINQVSKVEHRDLTTPRKKELDLGFATLGLCESGCKFAFSCPLKEGRAQNFTLIHANHESQTHKSQVWKGWKEGLNERAVAGPGGGDGPDLVKMKGFGLH